MLFLCKSFDPRRAIGQPHFATVGSESDIFKMTFQQQIAAISHNAPSVMLSISQNRLNCPLRAEK
jgi:hypothetical protein